MRKTRTSTTRPTIRYDRVTIGSKHTRFSLSLPPQALSSAGARWEIRKIYLWECRGGKRRREEKNGKGNVTEEIIRRSMKCSHLRLRMHNKRLMRPNEVYFHAVETQHRVARHNRAIVIINSTHLSLCTSVEVHSLSLACCIYGWWMKTMGWDVSELTCHQDWRERDCVAVRAHSREKKHNEWKIMRFWWKVFHS